MDLSHFLWAGPILLVNKQSQGLFAAFCGTMLDPLVVKDSFLRGCPIFSQKVAKSRP